MSESGILNLKLAFAEKRDLVIDIKIVELEVMFSVIGSIIFDYISI